MTEDDKDKLIQQAIDNNGIVETDDGYIIVGPFPQVMPPKIDTDKTKLLVFMEPSEGD